MDGWQEFVEIAMEKWIRSGLSSCEGRGSEERGTKTNKSTMQKTIYFNRANGIDMCQAARVSEWDMGAKSCCNC